MMTQVFCSFRQVGMHAWESAPDAYAYLRAKHRHEFHVRVNVHVTHDDRDVEFIHLKEMAITCFGSLATGLYYEMFDFGAQSCEQLAIGLMARLEEDMDVEVVSIEVSEDGENGARITR